MTAAAAPAGGLTSREAAQLLREIGPNLPVEERVPPPAVGWVLRIVREPMTILLLAAAAVYVSLGDVLDAVVALAALVPIAVVSVALELRAEHALAQLSRLAAPVARVLRDGALAEIPAAALVPGDVLELREGDVVPADARLVAVTQLQVDESMLSGESLPVEKGLGDDAVWQGTTVLSGRARCVVTATGPRTRYGEIGLLLAKTKQPPTPLEHAIDDLFRRLAVAALAASVAVVAIEIARGAPTGAALIAGVSIAMAAIPEELPMVFALFLGLGAWRLARDRALVRRLAAVETLGATTVICTDKTGTLTTGRLELATVVPLDGSADEVLRAAVLASERDPFDPIDAALVRGAAARGVDVARLHAGKIARDHPFDPQRGYVTHVWRDAAPGAYAKGALEGILHVCRASEEVRTVAEAAHRPLAGAGLRVIAVASGAPGDGGSRADDERGLALRGLVAFHDPPREGVAAALAECRSAGIRVLLVTGDHPATARTLGAALGFGDAVLTGTQLEAARDDELATLIERASIFARITPGQKHRLVRALRARGQVVAMTGDGTNDAPALREADIGIAMGRRGTEVARAAATLVLLDDDFSTIVRAVRDGRRIYENLRHAFSYLVGFHLPILVAAAALPIAGAPILLQPVHLVWLEIIVHPTSSLAFEADRGAADLMARGPRSVRGGLLDRRATVGAVGAGLALAAVVLALYLGQLALGATEAAARATALVALFVGQSALVLVERATDGSVLEALRRNRVLAPLLAAGTASLALALATSPARALLRLEVPEPGWIAAAALAGLASTAWREALRARSGARPQEALDDPAGRDSEKRSVNA